MDFNYLSPYIRVALNSFIYPPWTIHERVIFDYELLYVKDGEVIVTVEDEVYIGHPGDIFLFKPKQRHSIKPVNNCRFHQPHIHFDLFYENNSPDVKVSFKCLDKMTKHEINLFREDVTSKPNMLLPNKFKLRNTEYFEEMLFEIIKEYEKKLPYYEISLKGLFIKLWTYLLREHYRNENKETFSSIEELNRIKDYLDHNSYREVNLDELVNEFKISKFHLIRLFKSAFAMTPIHYHQMVRFEKIKEKIQFSDISFTQIAEMFGFNSINAFSRAFRNVEKVPPSYYRTRGTN